ncbi:hypothetical protein FBQ83_12365 [Chloroflexi bacterium CFX5]|nr:hypothetical protein [Chloroflexi bacterium CFX5]
MVSWVESSRLKVTCNLQPATCNLQPATCNLQLATCNLQPLKESHETKTSCRFSCIVDAFIPGMERLCPGFAVFV